MKNLEGLIKTYNDFPKKGIAFKDILGIMQDTAVFRELILKMSSNNIIKNSDAIISIEARGFIFGSAISLQSLKPMVVARKPGKLPGDTINQSYNLRNTFVNLYFCSILFTNIVVIIDWYYIF